MYVGEVTSLHTTLEVVERHVLAVAARSMITQYSVPYRVEVLCSTV